MKWILLGLAAAALANIAHADTGFSSPDLANAFSEEWRVGFIERTLGIQHTPFQFDLPAHHKVILHLKAWTEETEDHQPAGSPKEIVIAAYPEKEAKRAKTTVLCVSESKDGEHGRQWTISIGGLSGSFTVPAMESGGQGRTQYVAHLLQEPGKREAIWYTEARKADGSLTHHVEFSAELGELEKDAPFGKMEFVRH